MTGFVNKRVLYPLYILSATSWILVLILRFRLGRASFLQDTIIRWIQILSIAGIICTILSVVLYRLCNAIDNELIERDKKLIALERSLKELSK